MANEPQLVELGFDGALLDLINGERTKAGIKPLNDNDQVDDAADNHALDMAKNMQLSDIGSDGSTLATRAKAAGFASPNVQETIAAGPMDVKEVLAQWLNDPTQKAKILDPTLTEAGLGTVADTNGKLYWSEVFGGPEVAPAPAPAPAPMDPMTPPVAANPDPMTPPADPMTPPVAANPDPMAPPANPMEPAKDPIKNCDDGKKKDGKKNFGENKFFDGKKKFGGNGKKNFGEKKFFDKKDFGKKKMDKDPLGATSVGDPKDFQPSKDPIKGGGKNPMDMKMAFSPKDGKKFGDMKDNPIVGDVKNFQPMNDPMGAPQNPMGTSDMMSAPNNPMVMH
jgi:hypothetical protein